MAIGWSCYSSERDALCIYDRRAFDALLSPIYRVSARLLAAAFYALVMQQSTATSESCRPMSLS